MSAEFEYHSHENSVRRLSLAPKEELKPVALAYSVHLFTGLGAILGLFSLYLIHLMEFQAAFWLMGMAILVDAVDGTFARHARVKEVTPNFDGALLDNLIDYLNYAVVPAFFLLVRGMLPHGWNALGAMAILIASAYQFSRADAKTADHYFKGFPSYWNIAIFYLECFAVGTVLNLLIVAALAVLSFVPIKYIYPSRLTYFSQSMTVRNMFLGATILWGIATFGMLVFHPEQYGVLTGISLGYVMLYTFASLYRTLIPLPLAAAVDDEAGPAIEPPDFPYIVSRE